MQSTVLIQKRRDIDVRIAVHEAVPEDVLTDAWGQLRYIGSSVQEVSHLAAAATMGEVLLTHKVSLAHCW